MGSYIRGLPLWLRYVCALTSGAIIVVALVLYVQHHQQPLSEAPAAPTPAEAAQDKHQDLIIVSQEQAPQTVRLARGMTPAAGAARAVTAEVRQLMNQGTIPAEAVDGSGSCSAAGGTVKRVVLHCNVLTGSVAQNKSLRYPFDAVVLAAARTVTYCEVVTSPDPNFTSPPVSARCR